MTQKPFAQIIVESDELTATKQLLDHADGLLGGMRFIDRDAHALTAVLASGAEKLLKLTLGFTLAHIEGAWPGDTIKGYGHRVSDLDADCRALLHDREPVATNPGVVSAARADVEHDAWLPGIMSILQGYAVKGRFYNLDYLGQNPQPEPSPRDRWNQLDNETWESDSTALTDDGMTFDANERRRADAWQRSLRRWREFYYQCWVQNMCGPDARKYAFDVRGPLSR